MVAKTEETLCTWDLDGIVWDELKTLTETDHHPLALEACGGPAVGGAQIAATCELFAACNRAARAVQPDLRICSFIYAHLDDAILEPWSATEGFDDIGCDGKVWRTDDSGSVGPKLLLEHAPRYVARARALGRRSLALIETQALDAAQAALTLERLDDLLGMGLDHLMVYYQPLVKEPAAQITGAIASRLGAWRRGETT